MKKLICIIFVLIFCAMSAGCAKEEELCGTPLPPAMMEMHGISDYYALKEAAAMTDDELKVFLEEQGYADGDITDRAQVERCIWLLERVPVTDIDGYDLLRIEVYPDNDRMQVDYCFSGNVTCRYFAKDAGELGIGTGTPNIELGEELDYHNSTVNYYAAKIDGIPAEITIPENRNIESLIGRMWLGRASGLWEEYNRIENDPGPPTQWHFDTVEAYFGMEESMQLEDSKLEAYAEEHGWWLVPGFDSIRETAERISEMVHEVKIPQLDGYKMEFIIVNPEVGRSKVFVRLQGAQTIHVLYTFEEKWEKEWIASLGKNGDEPIENSNAEKMYFKEHDENIEGEQIYRFGALVNGKYARIFVFGGGYEYAKEAVSAMRFISIDELRG